MTGRGAESSPLDQELKQLLIETNDLRRRAGQAFYHFYRTLVFWSDKGHSFADSTRAWAPGGAAIFSTLADVLRPMSPHREDEALRAYVGALLLQLASDLERGDHMRYGFLRWMEQRFPGLTKMMQSETATTQIYDHALAQELADAFHLIAGASDRELPARMREIATRIATA